MKRISYKNPPIREALVEFQFAANEDWNITIPGRFHEQIKDNYPLVEQQKIREVQVDDEGLKYSEGLGKTQFLTEDRTRIIGIGKDVLSVHMLRPYQPVGSEFSGWQDFEGRIKTSLDKCENIIPSKGVTRIGLRYINEIFGAPNTKATLYLKDAPTPNESLPEMASFMSRTEHHYDDSTKLFVIQVSKGESTEKPVFFLDIELTWEGEILEKDAALAKTEELRAKKNEVFEALITDEARELFNA